jgi:cephalosporin-C deacetylase-like acetyl esterase
MLKRILTILCFFTATDIVAQRAWNVLDWKTEATLNAYLVQQMHQQYDARRVALNKALTSKQNMHAYIGNARKKYLQLLGQFPARTALNPVVHGTIREQGYSIEKISYESFPSHHVTANLYVPAGKGPFPAVLLFCGHEDISKASPSYQQTAILFAQHGFVVLVIDPISQSERHQLTDAAGKPLTRGGTSEHTLLNEASNLLGTSTPADELWDNTRSLDYLVTRPEVDTTRIGCLGNSGGAIQTIYFAGFDPRIKVMAPCSYLATRERTMEMTGPADGCAQMPGEGKAELEFTDYLLMAAPKPLLILAGRYDFIDYRGTEEAYKELKKAYTTLGDPGKVALFSYDDGHGISQPKREAVVAWFCRWLKKENRNIKETEVHINTGAELNITVTGQLASAMPAEKNIVQRNLELFSAFAKQRTVFAAKPVQDKLDLVAGIAGINVVDRSVTVEATGSITERELVYQKRIIRKKDETPLPVLLLMPGGKPRKIFVWLPEEGKSRIAVKTDTLKQLLGEGYAIVLSDLRGIGETEDKAEFNDPKYYNKEYRNAMQALHNGRNLVGQRATDVLSIVDMIAVDPQLKGLQVQVKASGVTALSVLHAMLFEKSIGKTWLSGSLGSYQTILRQPTERNWYSYVIPGVLQYYDITDLEKQVGVDRIVHQ